MKKKKINIFLDTDIGGDCDDAGAIALLNIFKNNGYVNILGMTHTHPHINGGIAIDIINAFYGNEDIPIGLFSKPGIYDDSLNTKFVDKMVENFDSNYKTNKKPFVALDLMRQTLVNLPKGEKCKLVFIGQLNNLSDLLSSDSDEYSPLTGKELVLEKVEEIIIMGGLFKEENEKIYYYNEEYKYEYNIATNIKSAQKVIKEINVPTVFIDFKVGYEIKTLKPLLDLMNLNHPVTFAYYHFSNKPRESWDLIAVYYSVLGTNKFFGLSEKGNVLINDKGETKFIQNKNGIYKYLKLKKNTNEIVEELNSWIMKGRIV